MKIIKHSRLIQIGQLGHIIHSTMIILIRIPRQQLLRKSQHLQVEKTYNTIKNTVSYRFKILKTPPIKRWGKCITFFPVAVETRTCLATKSRTSAATQAKSLSSTQTLEPLRRLILGQLKRNREQKESKINRFETKENWNWNPKNREWTRQRQRQRRNGLAEALFLEKLLGSRSNRCTLEFLKTKQTMLINPEK